ncbi:isocitrate lyase/phosphoenolpyruvate mutase family protein, partial [Micromonospora sp. STR1s_6]|nr:isocitrate lyase/phosphoenolpyruvate mutase family protein [Micromonospora tarensis]
MTVATFRALHLDRAAGDPLVLPGPWDAASARVFADAGFPALATPSAGVAAALGFEDGATPPDEMFARWRASSVPSPFRSPPTSRAVTGSPPPNWSGGSWRQALSVATWRTRRGTPRLKDAQRHADWLAEVRAEAGDALFINARVDTFLVGSGDPADAVERALLYVAAGADCVYPILAPPEVLPVLREGITGPLNMVAGPDRESVADLGRRGATRITFGPGLQRYAMAAIGD